MRAQDVSEMWDRILFGLARGVGEPRRTRPSPRDVFESSFPP